MLHLQFFEQEIPLILAKCCPCLERSRELGMIRGTQCYIHMKDLACSFLALLLRPFLERGSVPAVTYDDLQMAPYLN